MDSGAWHSARILPCLLWVATITVAIGQAAPAALAQDSSPNAIVDKWATEAGENGGAEDAPAAASVSSTAGSSAANGSLAMPARRGTGAGQSAGGTADQLPPTTTEIPSLVGQPVETEPLPAVPQGSVTSYGAAQAAPLSAPPVESLQEFVAEGAAEGQEDSLPLGMVVREDWRRFSNGHAVEGLLVVAVKPGSPAYRAGLHGYANGIHTALTGAAVAAALVFPPAIFLIPVLDGTHVGESYDLIIGIDGSRVTSLLDLQDRMRDLEPGEIVYLSVVRNGVRMQIAVQLPANFAVGANLP